jgi:hypothetical protein
MCIFTNEGLILDLPRRRQYTHLATQMQLPKGIREPLGNEPRKRALSRNLCCMNNLESHLRLVGLISPYFKLNLAYVGLFFPSMGTLFPRSRTA